MLGDETWLKLFPGLFMRHDGVTSFYVGLSHSFSLFPFSSIGPERFSSKVCYFNIFSFFQAKDTIQVDQNVSCHLEDELSRNDWNLLVNIF